MDNEQQGEMRIGSSRGRRDGFTLMELSIVLVIIGLLVGGIMVGKQLIRTAELNGILSDLDKYNAAVVTFKDKFGYLPGDIPTATQFWGIAGGNSSDNYTSSCFNLESNYVTGGTMTCNGNGNGSITYNDDCLGLAFSSQNLCDGDQEQFAVWQHLANAQLIAGIFKPKVGLAGTPYWVRTSGYSSPPNMPSSRHNVAEGFSLLFLCNVNNVVAWPDQCGHLFFYGAEVPASMLQNNGRNFPTYGGLTVAEAAGIDTKTDDGKPYSGTVRGIRWTSTPYWPICLTSTSTTSAAYDKNQPGSPCGLIFKAQF